jgi:hypothetical protein
MIIDIKTFESVLHSSIRNNKFHDFLLKFKHVLKDHDSGGMLDWYFWKIGDQSLGTSTTCHTTRSDNAPEYIPRNLFFYFDKNLPDDIKNVIDSQNAQGKFSVVLFDKLQSRDFLKKNYGDDCLRLFDGLRHPSEESDFMRYHVVNYYGGYWSDADEMLNQDYFLNYLSNLPPTEILLAQSQKHGNGCHGPLQSCFFGATKGHPIVQGAIDLLYINCINTPNLSMWKKTGPGPITRSFINYYLERAINQNLDSSNFSSLASDAMISVIGKHELRKFLTGFVPSYRGDERDWRVFESISNKKEKGD